MSTLPSLRLLDSANTSIIADAWRLSFVGHLALEWMPINQSPFNPLVNACDSASTARCADMRIAFRDRFIAKCDL